MESVLTPKLLWFERGRPTDQQSSQQQMSAEKPSRQQEDDPSATVGFKLLSAVLQTSLCLGFGSCGSNIEIHFHFIL